MRRGQKHRKGDGPVVCYGGLIECWNGFVLSSGFDFRPMDVDSGHKITVVLNSLEGFLVSGLFGHQSLLSEWSCHRNERLLALPCSRPSLALLELKGWRQAPCFKSIDHWSLFWAWQFMTMHMHWLCRATRTLLCRWSFVWSLSISHLAGWRLLYEKLLRRPWLCECAEHAAVGGELLGRKWDGALCVFRWVEMIFYVALCVFAIPWQNQPFILVPPDSSWSAQKSQTPLIWLRLGIHKPRMLLASAHAVLAPRFAKRRAHGGVGQDSHHKPVLKTVLLGRFLLQSLLMFPQ